MPTHRVRFSQGKALMHLARTYPTLALCIMEMIQNAIDAEATKIHVLIDLGKRQAVVQDNGIGITADKFREALGSVMESIKKRDKLGQFGIGLISPLGKAKSFTVTSKPRGGGEIHRWTFESDRIAAMSDRVEVPYTKASLLGDVKVDWTEVSWRTVVKLNDIVKDRVTSLVNLEELHEEILAKFGTAMRNGRTVCKIVLVDTDGRETSTLIQPREYAGQPIPISTYTQEDVGEVTFRLYRAVSKSGRRNGKVSVQQMDNNFAVPWKEFVNQARGTGWVKDAPAAFEALGSGYFEGVIVAKNIVLHPERTKFVWDDALAGLYMAIFEWFEAEGKALLNDEAEKAQANRYQDLGLKTLERWDELLDSDEYAHLRAALENTFVFGRLGSGHVTPADGSVNGPQDETSVRTGQGGAGKERTPSGEHNGKGNRAGLPDEERNPDRPGDVPVGVIGPRGQRRKLIKHDSIGLQLAYEPLETTRLWELDANLGILYLNTSNRLWERCESRDSYLLQLTDWVIFQVLHLLVLPTDQLEMAREFVDHQVKAYVELYILSGPPKRR